MKISKLVEARKNPAQNSKADIFSYLSELVSNAELLPNGDPNAFVSFSTLQKLGIRPFPVDSNTPVGIYAYPVKYILDQKHLQMERNGKHVTDFSKLVPYAGNFPVINVLKIKNPDRVLYLSNEQQKQQFIVKVTNWLKKNAEDRRRANLSDNDLNEVRRLGERFEFESSSKNPYALFQRLFATYLNERQMTLALLEMGYDAVYDDTGKRVISIEPYQIVFLNKSTVDHVDTHMNHKTYNYGQDDKMPNNTYKNNNITYESPPLLFLAGILRGWDSDVKPEYNSVKDALKQVPPNLKYRINTQLDVKLDALSVGSISQRAIDYSVNAGEPSFSGFIEVIEVRLRTGISYCRVISKLAKEKALQYNEFSTIEKYSELITKINKMKSIFHSTKVKKMLIDDSKTIDQRIEQLLELLTTNGVIDGGKVHTANTSGLQLDISGQYNYICIIAAKTLFSQFVNDEL